MIPLEPTRQLGIAVLLAMTAIGASACTKTNESANKHKDELVERGHDAVVRQEPTAEAQAARPQPRAKIIQIVAGDRHTCVLLDTGAVRCWGKSADGRLGYGNTRNIGDDEPASAGGEVNLGGKAIQINAGDEHTCALLDGGAVRCWGKGSRGQLGYGNTNSIGDDEMPAAMGDVPVGGKAVQIAAGGGRTCALMDSGRVRCWGDGNRNALGRGRRDWLDVGDDETPASVGDVPLDGPIDKVAMEYAVTCALLRSKRVRCWPRRNYAEEPDDRTAGELPDIDIGGPVRELFAGKSYSCALMEGRPAMRCWGDGGRGRHGYPNESTMADQGPDAPAALGDVQTGGPVVMMAGGADHTCVLLEGGAVRCWGYGRMGQLGYGSTEDLGTVEPPAKATGLVELGAPAVQIAAGSFHTCALLQTGSLRCWGWNQDGQLGYGHTRNIGDDETPASAGDVPVL